MRRNNKYLLIKIYAFEMLLIALFSASLFAQTDLLLVRKAAGAPVIDGKLDVSWLAIRQESLHPIYREWDVLPTPDDLSGNFRIMWNPLCLFLFARIYDDVIYTEIPAGWENDEFELYFDGDNSKNGPWQGDTNDIQLSFVFGREPVLYESFGGIMNIENIVVDYCALNDGYTVEIALPFDDLPFAPDPYHLFGFEVQVNDNDGEEHRDAILKWWADDDDAWFNPSKFGTAILLPRPPGLLKAAAEPTYPSGYVLKQNFPNPFNPNTAIRYSLPEKAFVALVIFGLDGKRIKTLIYEQKDAGDHTVIWDGKNADGQDVASGAYLYKITANHFTKTHKLTLVR